MDKLGENGVPGASAPGDGTTSMLGELLISSGRLNAAELEDALLLQAQSGERLGEILLAHDLISRPGLGSSSHRATARRADDGGAGSAPACVRRWSSVTGGDVLGTSQWQGHGRPSRTREKGRAQRPPLNELPDPWALEWSPWEVAASLPGAPPSGRL